MLQTYSFKGNIWKVRIDTKNHLAVIEIRNGAEYTTSFHVIDLTTRKQIISDWILHEPWLIGIEDIHNGILYTHQYRSPEIPEHYGIYAYDTRTKLMLWEQPELSWFKKTNLSILAHYLTPEGIRQFVALDLSGKIIQRFGEQIPIHVLQEAENVELEAFERMRFPQAILLDKPENKEHLAFFRTFAPALKFHYSEYLNYQENHILSYYSMNKDATQTSMNNNFVIYNTNKNKKLCEVYLAQNVHKFAVDTFYMYENHLFFIQYPNVLHVYSFEV